MSSYLEVAKFCKAVPYWEEAMWLPALDEQDHLKFTMVSYLFYYIFYSYFIFTVDCKSLL